MQNVNFNELWSAYYMIPSLRGEAKFRYGKVKIKSVNEFNCETVYPYFISKDVSTRFFDDSMLNKEYMITDELTVFYSGSKEKCIEWLEEKRKTLLENSKSLYERVCDSTIEQEDE